MIEEWKDIEGYEGKYQVSNLGRFIGPRGIQQGHIQGSGYVYVCIYDKPKQKVLRLHRLVAKYFCDNPKGYDIVDHIDGNRHNNAASNLEWVTSSENMKRAEARCTIPHVCNFNYKRSVEIVKDGERKVFPSIASVSRFLGVSKSNISHVCRGRFPTIKGWICRYIEDIDVNFNRRIEISKDNVTLLLPSVAAAARHIGVSRSSINRVCKGVRPLIKEWKCKYVYT